MINILMSTYNGERYLSEQLESIVAQTYTTWRLYIRDDGSTDDTMAILNKYATDYPTRIFVDKTEKNKLGAMRSFEYLLAHHNNAEYFAFADQDDVWDLDKLLVCIEAIKREEENKTDIPIVIHTDLKVVDENLNEIASSFWEYSNIQPDLLDNHLQYLAICNSATGCTMLFNKLASECSLPMSENAYMHDAWVALMTACHAGKIIPLHRATVAYRQHKKNVLGAVHYVPFGRSITRRLYEAKLSYRRAYGYVFHNRVQFIGWKVIYYIHRLF